jgi:hypothetical protein
VCDSHFKKKERKGSRKLTRDKVGIINCMAGHSLIKLVNMQYPIAKDGRHEMNHVASHVQSTMYRCIALESSVPQGMFVCFDKRGWLVCRNSGDTRERGC